LAIWLSGERARLCRVKIFSADCGEESVLPLYEYKCVKCGHRFEKIEKVEASETKKCPKCGARAPRMAAAPAIQFKGSGWYVTDYAGKNSSGTSADKAGSGDGSSSISEKGEKSESKPAERKPSSDKDSSKKESKK
jgi:putative FmdB family regulatory protein